MLSHFLVYEKNSCECVEWTLPQRKSVAGLCAGLQCQPVLPISGCLSLGIEIKHGTASAQQTWMQFIWVVRHREMPYKLLCFSDFCKSMSGFHYHIIAVGHKIPLENSSDQTSVLEMAYCCILELSFSTGKPVKKKICLHLQLRAKDFLVMRGKISCSLSVP